MCVIEIILSNKVNLSFHVAFRGGQTIKPCLLSNLDIWCLNKMWVGNIDYYEEK